MRGTGRKTPHLIKIATIAASGALREKVHGGDQTKDGACFLFLLRSTFWLLAAYLVIGAQGASGDPERLVSAGRDFLAESVRAVPCESLECQVGRAAAVAAMSPAERPAVPHAAPAPQPAAPVPPPRPAWAG